MGFMIGPYFIDTDDELVTNIDKGHNDVLRYMWNSAIIVTVMCAPLILFYRERPKYYPSKIAKHSKKEERNFKEDFKTLWANKNYLIFTCSFMLLYG